MGKAVVTGANRGIGLELCRLLKERGVEVVAVCRSSSPELEALGVQIEPGVDVTSDEDVAGLNQRLDGQEIDLLINNAGLLTRETFEDMDFDGIRKQFEVNTLGPLRVTTMLASKFHEGTKVAVISSRMGSISDNTSGSRYGYRISKAALNMGAKSMAHDLASKGVPVAILHPGFVKTGMTGNNGDVEPAEAATGLLDRIDGLSMENTGTFWHAKGQELPW